MSRTTCRCTALARPALFRPALQLHRCSTKSFGWTFILREQSGHQLEPGSKSLFGPGHAENGSDPQLLS